MKKLLPRLLSFTYLKVRNNKPLYEFVLFIVDNFGIRRMLESRITTPVSNHDAYHEYLPLSRLAVKLEKQLAWARAWTTHSQVANRTLYLVCPLPPDKSGVADYSLTLGLNLAAYFNLVFVVEDGKKSPGFGQKIITAKEFRECVTPEDAVVYQMGNSPFHAFMEQLLEDYPGILDLHDLSLADLQMFQAQGDLRTPWLIEKIVHEIGWRGARLLPNKVADLPPLISKYVYSSIHTIVHNRAARQRILSSHPSVGGDRITVIPLVKQKPSLPTRAEARKHLGIADDSFLISTFGYPSREKYSVELAAAVSDLASAEGRQIELAYVGKKPNPSLLKDIQKSAAKNNYSGLIFSDWVSDAVYLQFLAATDLCVQLRSGKDGESSAAIIDCMLAGKPVMTSDIPANEDFEQGSVFKSSLHNLVDDLRYVIRNDSETRKMAELGKKFAESEYLPESSTEKYALCVRRSYEELDKRERSGLEKKHQLFVDVTAINANDLGTGIQRVVNQVLRNWLAFDDSIPETFEVTPVYFNSIDNSFYSAERIRAKLLGWPTPFFRDSKVEPTAGDIFLGLDLVFNNLQFETLLSWRSAQVKIYFVVYDLLPILYPEFFPEAAVRAFTDWAKMTSEFDGVYCISNWTAQCYRETNPELSPLFSVEVFPMGSELQLAIHNSAADHIKPKESAITKFLMVGTIEPRKGHVDIVRAFGELWKRDTQVELTIVGKWGWLSDDTIEEIKSAERKFPGLKILEGLSDDELKVQYERHDCLIAASYAEGFGLPIIEASSYGLNILARDIPIFREVAGEGADYFDSNEELPQQLLDWMTKFQSDLASDPSAIKIVSWYDSAKSLMQRLQHHSPGIQSN